jgi:hypothetical protein
MTDITVPPSQFVSPSERAELEGRLGLELHEIAKTMALDFSKVKRKYIELEKDNEISGVQIGVRQNQGLTIEREVESFVLDVDNAKLLVTQLGGKLSIAYCKHLIQCEKRLEDTSLKLETLFNDPAKGILFLQKVAEQNEKIKGLQGRIGQIAEKREATAMATASNLTRYIKKSGLPVPKYAKTLEPEVDEAAVEELANKKAIEYMTAAREAALKARSELTEYKAIFDRTVKHADELSKELLFYKNQEREENEAATKNWPKPEWRVRADILREWGIDTGAPGQQGWKDFGTFCRGLNPSLSRWNDITKKYELRVDVANKFRAQIVDFFALDLGSPLYEGSYSGEF